MTTTLPPAANPFDDPASDPLALAAEAAAVIAERSGAATHDIALVLGSGWGQTADLVG